jgi:DnaJ-class molecular chaperone
VHSDHYQALGVPPGADAAAVRAAYLRVMRDHHPDRRPGNSAATDRARRANAAWEVLGHSARRAAYDRLRAPRGAARPSAVTHVAYSPEHHRCRAQVHDVTVRVAAGVLAAGTVLLAALS